MILILSKASHELSTDKVVAYLEKYNASYLRINGADLLQPGAVYIDLNNQLTIKGVPVDAEAVNVVFNRRWYDQNEVVIDDLPSQYDSIPTHQVQDELLGEFFSLSQYIKSKFQHAIWIPERKSVNKLKVLETAHKIGLNIPKTFVCSRKSDLIAIRKTYPNLITKAIGDLLPLKSEKRLLSFLTKAIDDKVIAAMPETFFPSLIQEQLPKEYEIRIFYFYGAIYSMAIFSQRDTTTSVDFRNYNHEKPNRTVPYQLPKWLEDLIRTFMDAIHLNTGSLDFIFFQDQYFFLEVNPVGQFGMVNHPCGYDLYDIIAQQLIKLDNHENG